MRTPAGNECRYFYGDYYRGRNHEECRLLNSSSPPQNWQPKLCAACPVPGILRANSCEHMHLTAQVKRPLLILSPRVEINAFCSQSQKPVSEPHVGCGQCHPFPEVFIGESIDPDTTG